MEEADFGFDESEWADFKDADEAEDAGAVTEVLPQLEITDDMSTEEKLKILKSRYPEFEPLAKDFTDLQSTHKELQTQASNAQTPVTDDDDDEPQPASVAVIKLRALSAYLGAIGMYFMLLASSSDGTSGSVSMSPAELRQHPVMGSLVKFRKLWEKVKNVEEIVDLLNKDSPIIRAKPFIGQGTDKQGRKGYAQKEQLEACVSVLQFLMHVTESPTPTR